MCELLILSVELGIHNVFCKARKTFSISEKHARKYTIAQAFSTGHVLT